MPNDKMELRIILPEKVITFNGIDSVYLPGTEGELGILPMHTEFMSSLRAGEVEYEMGSIKDSIIIDNGFLEVADNKVNIVTSSAEFGKDINLEEALRRKQKAEDDLEKAREEDTSAYSAAKAKLMKEILRVNVANKYD